MTPLKLTAYSPGTVGIFPVTHTEVGQYGPESWLKVYAEHLEKHSRQLEGNLAAWAKR